jgi:hypothetical protein
MRSAGVATAVKKLWANIGASGAAGYVLTAGRVTPGTHPESPLRDAT